MKKWISLALVAAMAMNVSIVMAQPAPGQRGQGGGGMQRGGGMMQRGGMQITSVYQMLRRNDVQKDLKMTAEQIKQVSKIDEDQMATMQSMRDQMQGMDRETMMQMMQKMQEDNEKKAIAILDEKQKLRLTEIQIQLLGVEAITVREVQKKLEFTNAQEQRVRNAVAARDQSRQQLMQSMRGGGGDRTQMQSQMDEINKKFAADLEKIPTAEQTAKLKTLSGEPFKADEQPQGGGRRGGGEIR